MSYRVNYCICPLHEEPLNYICLHANCQSDRVICAICLQERHSNAHHTLPLKLYLTNKLHKLKCLTESEDAQIESSLIQQKSQSLKQLDELGIEIFESLGNLKIQFESFYDSQLAALRACRELISKEVIEVEKLEQIESAVQAAANFDEYSRAAAGQIEKIRADVIERIESLHPEEVLIDHSWVGHPELDINRSILISSMHWLMQRAKNTKLPISPSLSTNPVKSTSECSRAPKIGLLLESATLMSSKRGGSPSATTQSVTASTR